MSSITRKDSCTGTSNRAKLSPTAVERLALIAGLNEDLAGEYQSIWTYIHYSAKLTGPYRRELRAMFQAEITEEQGHAQFLADKIVALGGDPTVQLRTVAIAEETRGMLEQALVAEQHAIANYEERVRQAAALKNISLKVGLENLLADETRHAEELQLILVGWNEQNRERVRNEDRWQDDGGQG